MKATVVYWGYIRIMNKENGNYHSMLGLYRDNGKKKETIVMVYSIGTHWDNSKVILGL